MKEPSSTKTTDIQPAALLEISLAPHTGIPQLNLKLNDYFKENPWIAASKYNIYSKS